MAEQERGESYPVGTNVIDSEDNFLGQIERCESESFVVGGYVVLFTAIDVFDGTTVFLKMARPRHGTVESN